LRRARLSLHSRCHGLRARERYCCHRTYMHRSVSNFAIASHLMHYRAIRARPRPARCSPIAPVGGRPTAARGWPRPLGRPYRYGSRHPTGKRKRRLGNMGEKPSRKTKPADAAAIESSSASHQRRQPAPASARQVERSSDRHVSPTPPLKAVPHFCSRAHTRAIRASKLAEERAKTGIPQSAFKPRCLAAASSRPMPNALGLVSSPASIRPHWRRALAPDGAMYRQTLMLPLGAGCSRAGTAFFGRPLRLPDWPRFQLVDRLPRLGIASFRLFVCLF
jgi:hypothetical protein